MGFIAHEQAAYPSARQSPHGAGEKIQCGVSGIVIVAKNGAVDSKPNVIPVRERAVGTGESEEQRGPSCEQHKSREGLISPRPSYDEIGKDVREGDLRENVEDRKSTRLNSSH